MEVRVVRAERKELRARATERAAKERELDQRLLALKGSASAETLQARLRAMQPAPSTESLASLNERLAALTGKPALSLDTSAAPLRPLRAPLSFEEEARLLIQEVQDEIALERQAATAHQAQ